MIGRQLNLNRARELALANDQAGLLKEIVKQVGSEAELNRLNVIQRKALAESLGITVSELQKLAGGEVELGSPEIRENTEAVKNLTYVLGFGAASQAGRMLSTTQPAIQTAIMRAMNRAEVQSMKKRGFTRVGIDSSLRAMGAAGMRGGALVGGVAAGAGSLLGVAAGIGTLVFLVKGIVSLFKKNNDTQKDMARRSVTQAQNFPVFSSEVLSGN